MPYKVTLSVVKQVSQYIEDPVRPAKTSAPELWNFIYDVIDVFPKGHLRVAWSPSHLDDPKKKLKRDNLIADGTTSLLHIAGIASQMSSPPVAPVCTSSILTLSCSPEIEITLQHWSKNT